MPSRLKLYKGLEICGCVIERTKPLGCGCTAEVYAGVDLVTREKRATKIFFNDDDALDDPRTKRRLVESYGLALDDLAPFRITPRCYYVGLATAKKRTPMSRRLINFALVLERIPDATSSVTRKRIDSDPNEKVRFLKQFKLAVDEYGYYFGEWHIDHLRFTESGHLIHIDPDLGTSNGLFASDENERAKDFTEAAKLLRVQKPRDLKGIDFRARF